MSLTGLPKSTRKPQKSKNTILHDLERSRPNALRDYDQIAMHGRDLLAQVEYIAPSLANQSVVFVGDHDGTAALLGALSRQGYVPEPARIMVLDFDIRVLEMVEKFSHKYEFQDLLEVEFYNVFDPLPVDLVEAFNVFYTNPPYGMSNQGESGRLFIVRGCEMVLRQGGFGYVILPNDTQRPWTLTAFNRTAEFLRQYGWMVQEVRDEAHGYHLDDDPTLRSASIKVQRMNQDPIIMPWARRAVPADAIPFFYGRSVKPPYPQCIRRDGSVEIRQLESDAVLQNQTPCVTWIFQANPKYYDILKSIENEHWELWGCTSYRDKIKSGDRVLIWVSGKEAGIYAIGQVLKDPHERPDTVAGLNYWIRLERGLEQKCRVVIRYEQRLLDRPLLRRHLAYDERLGSLSIFKNARGTNFKVLPAEWEAIASWLQMEGPPNTMPLPAKDI
jgi:N4-bis(aminopropyl)spermidine synthase